MATQNQIKHTYPIELYYVILAIVVVVSLFILYNLLQHDTIDTDTVVSSPKQTVLSEARKAEISANFSAHEVKMTEAEKARIAKSFSK